MNASVDRVHAVLAQFGRGDRIRVLDESTHTAQQAADAMGVAVAQIAKSIVFQAAETRRAVVVITRGDRRVQEKVLATRIEEPVERAHPDWVREKTGYPIGGVSPLGHNKSVVLLLDQALWDYDLLYAAAGHPQTVFSVSPDELRQMTDAPVVDGVSR